MGSVTLGIRPESFRLAAEGNGIKARVGIVEELGAESFAYAELVEAGATPTSGVATPGVADQDQIIVRIQQARSPQIGETIHLQVDHDALLLFDSVTGERLGS